MAHGWLEELTQRVRDERDASKVDGIIAGYMEDTADWSRLSVRDRVQWACMCVPELRVHDVFKWSTTIGRLLARIMQRSEKYAAEALKGLLTLFFCMNVFNTHFAASTTSYASANVTVSMKMHRSFGQQSVLLLAKRLFARVAIAPPLNSCSTTGNRS